MGNEQKSGLQETLETGRTAAHMVRGAMKAGNVKYGEENRKRWKI